MVKLSRIDQYQYSFSRDMSLAFKIVSAIISAVCIIKVVQSQYTCQSNVKPNRDCSCDGYEAKAKQCGWKEKICDESSDSYRNYKDWCDDLNGFRDKKRAGETEATYNRTCTCLDFLSEEQRQKIQLGVKVPEVRPRSLDVGYTVAPGIPFNIRVPTKANWTVSFGPIKNQLSCGACWAFGNFIVN